MARKQESEIDALMRTTGMERAQASYHQRGRELVRLRLASPLRSAERQHDASECPLFSVACEPRLL